MGFNIGVYSEQISTNPDCHQFIDRMFYNLINSGDQYFDESILIQSGKYYGLDLSPLLKLVYTEDEMAEDQIKENIQPTNDLLDLVTRFRNGIENDPSVCDKIKYVWYDQSSLMSDIEKENFIKELGEDVAKVILADNEELRKSIEENPNPWKLYFEEKQIVNDLNNLIKMLQCFKDKGAKEVYLTAG